MNTQIIHLFTTASNTHLDDFQELISRAIGERHSLGAMTLGAAVRRRWRRISGDTPAEGDGCIATAVLQQDLEGVAGRGGEGPELVRVLQGIGDPISRRGCLTFQIVGFRNCGECVSLHL